MCNVLPRVGGRLLPPDLSAHRMVEEARADGASTVELDADLGGTETILKVHLRYMLRTCY